MNLGWNKHKCMLRTTQLESSCARKKAGDLSFTKSTDSWKKEVILPIYSATGNESESLKDICYDFSQTK